MGLKTYFTFSKRKISKLEDDEDGDDDYRSINKTMLPAEGHMEFNQYLNASITSFAKEKFGLVEETSEHLS